MLYDPFNEAAHLFPIPEGEEPGDFREPDEDDLSARDAARIEAAEWAGEAGW